MNGKEYLKAKKKFNYNLYLCDIFNVVLRIDFAKVTKFLLKW